MEEKTEQATNPENAKPEASQAVTEKRPKKKSFVRRLIKGLLWTIVGILLFAVVALLTLPLWINPVGTSLANALVPGYTGTAFNLERISLNPYTGKLLVSGVKLANPKGYAEEDAISLGSISAEVEVSSLFSKTIHVIDVTIDSPFASYVFDADGVNNFDRIIESVNKKLGPKKKKDDEPSDTKVVVDTVTIKNVRIVVGKGEFALATLTLSDFGKDTPAKLEIADVKLANPKGFPEPNAFSMKSLSIGMETADLSKKPMVFHDIIVDSTYAGMVYKDGVSNIDAMFKPFMGDDEDKEDDDKKKKEVAQADEKKDGKDEEDDSPRVVIDKLDISGTKIQYRLVSLPIPLPTFTDIGKDSDDGASAKEVGNQILVKAQEAMSSAGGLVGMLGADATNVLGNATSFLGASATNLLGSATGLVSGGVSNVLSGASGVIDGAKDISGKATEGLKNISGKATEGVKDLSNKATEGAKEALKKLGTGGGLFGD